MADQDTTLEQTTQEETSQQPAAEPAPQAEAPAAAPPAAEPPPQRPQGQQQNRPPREGQQGQQQRENRGGQPREGGRGPREGGLPRGGENRGGGRGDEARGPRREGEGRGDRREGGRDRGDRGGRPEMFAEIDLEKLISDPLYLDNQAHAVVSRMRDMDSGTRSQLRRLYNAVRRAVRAPESERQHEFVMLRARLAYTIARHGLRSLDTLEKLLLQVTRKNDARGYERFRDLFEAIVAYNE